MKKYADVSKVVYDPKGADPFTFRWYDPDEVIAGKKMREHLKFALSYWHTIDAEGVDMFGSGTMDKSMGQTDPGQVPRQGGLRLRADGKAGHRLLLLP